MSIDEMKEYLIGVQKELPETKILNAILAQQEDIENIRKVLIETQARVNEIINAIQGAAAPEQETTTSDSEMPTDNVEAEVVE